MTTPVKEKEPAPGDVPEVGYEGSDAVPELHQPVQVKWYRGTTFQVFIVGLSSFLAPGAYAALAATGAGGLANVDIGNASVALAYALIVPSALTATGFLSKLLPRMCLAIGAAGYVFYSSALYQNSATGNQWYLILGAIICGLTSGIFWVSEGAIVMIYSEPERRGRLLALWQTLYQLATTMGGAINLALNIHLNQKGGLAPKTYLVFVGLNVLAPIVSFLLSNPKQVQRKDGRPVPNFPSEGFWKETWLTIIELRDPRIFACAFLWSQSLFIPSWISTYLAKTFSVRVRGLSSLIKPILSIIWFQIMGIYLDNKRTTIRMKLVITWGFLLFVSTATAIWLLILQRQQYGVVPKPFWDWSTPGFAAAYVPVMLAYAAQGVSYGYYYYMAGYVFPREADGARISRIISSLRSAESGSAAIAFGINSIGYPLYKIGIINLVFLFVSIVCGLYVLQWIWKEDKKGTFDEKPRVEGAPETR